MRRILLLGLLAACSGAAGAEELLLGGSVSMVGHKYSDVDNAVGGNLFLDYRLDALPVDLEYRYMDAGKASISSSPGDALSFKGSVLSAAWTPWRDSSGAT